MEKTLAQRIEETGITMTCERADRNPNMTDDDWARGARHWKCVLKNGRRTLTVYFSQGCAHTQEPTVNEVLSCLCDDASQVENASYFEEWARDLGFDEDSRKAFKTWTICEKQAEKLSRFLGDEYDAFLNETERE